MENKQYFKFGAVPRGDDNNLGESAKVSASEGVKIGSGLPVTLERLASTWTEHHGRELERGQQELHRLQDSADKAKANATANSLESDIKNGGINFFQFDFNGAQNKLTSSNNKLKLQNSALVTHMKLNGLIALPTRADIVPWKIYLLVGFLFLVEALINAGLFMGTKGLIGALALTTAQSFINIVTSFTAGHRLIGSAFYHRLPLVRAGSASLWGLHLLFIMWLNLSLGLWRSLIDQVTASGRVDLQVNPEFLNQVLWPFPHMDSLSVEGLLIVLTGIVFSMISYFKGFFSDDPRPGLGRLYRSVKKEYNNVVNLSERINENWRSECQNVRSLLNSKKDNLHAAATSWSQSMNLIEKIKVDWENLFGNLNQNFNSKIALYFTAYNSITTEPVQAPSYELLTGTEINSEIVFSDVRQYFLSDNERRTIKEENDALIEQESKRIAGNITEYENTGSIKIQEFSQKFPSISIGEGI